MAGNWRWQLNERNQTAYFITNPFFLPGEVLLLVFTLGLIQCKGISAVNLRLLPVCTIFVFGVNTSYCMFYGKYICVGGNKKNSKRLLKLILCCASTNVLVLLHCITFLGWQLGYKHQAKESIKFWFYFQCSFKISFY